MGDAAYRAQSPRSREQLSEGADERPGLRVPVAPTRRAHQQFQNFLDPASDRSRAPPRSWKYQAPDHSSQNPSASATPDEPQCTCPGSCSQCYLVLCFLGSSVFLPRENPPAAAGTRLRRTGAGRVGSLSRGQSQVVAGSRLWLLLPGVRNPFQSFCGEKNFFK